MKPRILFAIVLLLVSLTGMAGRASAQGGVRPGDSFDLKISGVPSDDSASISGTYTVDRDGCVNISYLNKLKVVGKESGEIQSMIENAYRSAQIFTHPSDHRVDVPVRCWPRVCEREWRGQKSEPYSLHAGYDDHERNQRGE